MSQIPKEGKGKGKAKLARATKSLRAGIVFPVARVKRMLKKMNPKVKRINVGAAVYLASVLEYLTAEVMELGGNAARDNKRRRIVPRHILLAIGNDEELNELCKGAIIPAGGKIPYILPELRQLKKKGRSSMKRMKRRRRQKRFQNSYEM